MNLSKTKLLELIATTQSELQKIQEDLEIFLLIEYQLSIEKISEDSKNNADSTSDKDSEVGKDNADSTSDSKDVIINVETLQFPAHLSNIALQRALDKISSNKIENIFDLPILSQKLVHFS